MGFHEKKKYKRMNTPGDPHALTFSCYKFHTFLKSEQICRQLARSINKASVKYELDIWAWVFMPEHVHVLFFPRAPVYSISDILKSIKQPVSRKVINNLKMKESDQLIYMKTGSKHHPYKFWQDGGGYDRNIRSKQELQNWVDYIHENPVSRGLVKCSIDWYWSSARSILLGEHGPVKLNMELF